MHWQSSTAFSTPAWVKAMPDSYYWVTLKKPCRCMSDSYVTQLQQLERTLEALQEHGEDLT